MGRFFSSLTTLTIPNGGTASNVVTLPDDCERFTIYAPATLTAAVSIQVSPDGTNWFGVTPASGGTAVTIAVTTAVPIMNAGFKAVRVNSAGAEGGARTFLITCQNQN